MPDGTAPAVAPATGDAASTGEITEGAEAQPQTPAVVEDPEIELDDGVKIKRSELRALHKNRKDLDRGAYEKMQEAAKLRKEAGEQVAQAKTLVADMSKDTKAKLRAAGIDPIKFAEQVLQEALDEHQLSPEQKEARDLKAENDRLKAEDKQRKEDEEKTHAETQIANWERAFSQGFQEAFDAVGLPKDADTVLRMTTKVEAYWGNGIKVPLSEIAAEVRSDMIRQNQHFLKTTPVEKAAEVYGKEGLETARKASLATVQGGKSTTTKLKAPEPRKTSSKGLSNAELSARIDKRMGIA